MEQMKKPKVSTAIMIRDELKKTQPNYIWALWHRLHIERKLTRMKYASFCSYFKVLEKLGLVLRVDPPKTEPPIPKYRRLYGFKSAVRKWYKVNPAKMNSSQWMAPERALYPKIFKVSGRRTGRPAGSKNKPKK